MSLQTCLLVTYTKIQSRVASDFHESNVKADQWLLGKRSGEQLCLGIVQNEQNQCK